MHKDWKFFIFSLTLFVVLFGGAAIWRYRQWQSHRINIVQSCDLYLGDAGGLCFDLSDGKGHHIKPTKEQWTRLALWIDQHPSKLNAGKCMDGGGVETTVSCTH